MIEKHGHLWKRSGKISDPRRIVGDEMPLDSNSEVVCLTPRPSHTRVAPITILDGAAAGRHCSGGSRFVNTKRNNAPTMLANQRFQPGGRFRSAGIEETRSCEKSGDGSCRMCYDGRSACQPSLRRCVRAK